MAQKFFENLNMNEIKIMLDLKMDPRYTSDIQKNDNKRRTFESHACPAGQLILPTADVENAAQYRLHGA